jgi:hypothetical protein
VPKGGGDEHPGRQPCLLSPGYQSRFFSMIAVTELDSRVPYPEAGDYE